jgi:cell division protein FtsN
MPDLNLIDEGGFEDVPEAPSAPPAKKSVKGGGGGSGRTILLISLCVVLAAGVVFYLNQRGIIKLWGKKPKPVVVQEEQFPPEPAAQPTQTAKPADTTEVALLDTAPVEEKVEAPKPEPAKGSEAKAAEQPGKKSKSGKKTEAIAETESPSKLSQMKGEFTVQVIAYREKSKAEETAKNLEFSGYPSFVEKIPMKGSDWYTVRIGHYATRDEAAKAVQSFGEQLQAHYVIDKVRSK